VDQHLAFAQTITKLLDVVCGLEGEVMIRQPGTDAGMMAQFVEQFGYVEARADVEEWFIEIAIELKHFASGPVFEIEVSRHVRDCTARLKNFSPWMYRKMGNALRQIREYLLVFVPQVSVRILPVGAGESVMLQNQRRHT